MNKTVKAVTRSAMKPADIPNGSLLFFSLYKRMSRECPFSPTIVMLLKKHFPKKDFPQMSIKEVDAFPQNTQDEEMRFFRSVFPSVKIFPQLTITFEVDGESRVVLVGGLDEVSAYCEEIAAKEMQQ